MSTHWTLVCHTCNVHGPDLRRSASGGAKLIGIAPWRQNPDKKETAQEWFNRGREDWTRFLIEHDYHDLRLEHE